MDRPVRILLSLLIILGAVVGGALHMAAKAGILSAWTGFGLACAICAMFAGISVWWVRRQLPSWSSETLGWVVLLKVPFPKDINFRAPDSAQQLRAYYKPHFDKLRDILPPGARIASMQDVCGTACVVGNKRACLALKKILETEGLATMNKNIVCIRAAAA